MSNEIKVGDKVRVREDAPELYTMYGQTDWESVESTVEKIDGDAAEIKYFNENSDEFDYTAIPTKYIVKVEEEKKEAKFKVGDRVEELVSRKSGRVLRIEGDFVVVGIPYDKEKHYWHIDSVELVEPTEQTEAEKKPYDGISEETANEISDMLEAYVKALSGIADSFDWQRYEAELAKEVALKVANKFNTPKEAAEYAVSVAKSVVEGLKRK